MGDEIGSECSVLWVKGEYYDDIAAVESVARGSLGRAQQPSLFDRLDWLKRTWAHCPPGERPLIVRARTEGADGWLFLARIGRDRLVALSSWYSLLFAPIFSGMPDRPLRRRLLRAMAKRLRAGALGVATIELAPLGADDAADLVYAFHCSGWFAVSGPATANWRLAVNGRTFAKYWADRPGRLRSTIERKGKGEPDTRIHGRFDEQAWAAYEAVYAESWKPEEGSPGFLRAFAEDEGTAGTLRLGITRLGGRAVAAQLWTVENGAAIIHKLAHVEDMREHSPGTLLSAAMFEHAIDVDGVQSIDFGTGDDAYKADWMDERRMLMRVTLFNPRRIAAWPRAARAWLSALVRGRSVD